MRTGQLNQLAERIRRHVIACVLLLFTVLFPAIGSAQGQVSVAYCEDCFPFQFRDADGSASGMVIDHWRLWSAKSGIQLQFISAPWAETIRMVRDGTADAHAGLAFTNERNQHLDFGAFVGKSSSHIFLHKALPPINGLSELAAYRVGVISGDFAQGFLSSRFPGIGIVEFEDYQSLVGELENGRLKAFAANTLTGMHHLRQGKLTASFAFPENHRLFQSDWFVAVAKGRQDLLQRVNEGLADISVAEQRAIAQRWLTNRGSESDDALFIAIDRSHPPLSLLNAEGEPAGMLVDFWRLWSEKTGRAVEFLSSRRQDTLRALREGQADLHAGLFPNRVLDPWVSYSNPIYQTTSSLYVAADTADTVDLAVLRGRRVGVVRDSEQESFLAEQHPNVRIVRHDSVEQLVISLLAQKIDAFIAEDAALEVSVEKFGLQGSLRRSSDPLFARGLHVGARSENGDLITVVNQGINAISRDELDQIEARWIPEAVRTANRVSGDRLNLTAEERAWLNNNPVVRVHNELDWPPFNFNEAGEPKGLSVDYMRLLASKVGLRVEFVSGPSWGEFLEMMKARQLDVMLNIVKTPDRLTYLSYTRPYIDNPNTILSKADAPYNSLEELFGKTISVPKGFFYEEILRNNFPQINLHLVKDTLESMKAVTFGQADAALGELAVFNFLKTKHFMTELVLSGEVKMGSPEFSLLNIASRKDQPLLASILDKAIQKVTPEEGRSIQRRWLEEGRISTESVPTVSLTDAERQWLAAHPTIRLGIDPSYPPFEFLDDNNVYSGISSEYVRLVGERLGVNLEVVPDLTWDGALQGVRQGTVDVLPAASRTPERESFMNFTQPHSLFQTVVLTRTDYRFISGLRDLSEKTIALAKGYAVTDRVSSQFPNIRATQVESPLEALRALAVGEVDATVMNLSVASLLIRSQNITNIKIAAPAEIELPGLSFAVRNDWPELVTILDKVLASVTPEERTAIQDKWVSVRFDVAADTRALTILGLQVGGGVIVVALLGFFLWSRRLRQEIANRRRVERAQRTVLEAISLPMIVVHRATSEIRFINDAAANGRAPEDILGKSAVNIYADPADRDTILNAMSAQGRIDGYEVRLKAFGDEPIWALLSSREITFEGQPSFLTTWTDITARKEAEEEIARNREILEVTLENTDQGISMYDADERLVVFNHRFAEMRGFKTEFLETNPSVREMAQHRVEAGFYPERDGSAEERTAELLKQTYDPILETGQPTAYEQKQADGSIHEVRSMPLEDGGIVRVMTDITERKLAADELEHSREILETTINSVDQGIVMIDGEHRVLTANERYSELIWVDHGYIETKPLWADVVREAHNKGWFSDDFDIEEMIENQRAIRSHATEPSLHQHVRSDGAIIEFWSKALPNGGWVQSVTDVTDIRKAEAEIARGKDILETTINSVDQGIIMVAEDGEILATNDYFEKQFGMPVAEYPNFEEYTKAYLSRVGATPDSIEKSLQLLRDNTAGTWERPIHDDLVFEISHTPLEGGGYVRTYNEITERLKAENALKEAKEEAEAAAEAKSNFVAVVSHEVRTPMNGVLGMARLMLESPLPKQQREYVQTIVESGEALLTILNDLLDISKLEVGKLEIETIPFAPKQLVEDSISVMAPRAVEKGLDLRYIIDDEVPGVLLGDANRLRQILFNLLSNGIKFTDEGSVAVDLAASDAGEGKVELRMSVSDTGIGISSDTAEKLFAPYVQATVDVAREHGGTGLGLSISRNLAELMSGEITLSSKEGEGSTFTFAAPFELTNEVPANLSAINHAGDAVRLKGSSNVRTLHILVVEDNLINRKVATTMLNKQGHSVSIAENGREALELIEARSDFDVIFMDRHMPVMDGIEATRRIRGMEGPIASIPIIAVTAAVTQHEIGACLKAGMNNVIKKPIDPDEVAAILAKVAEDAPVESADAAEPEESPDRLPVLDTVVLDALGESFGEDGLEELIDDFREIGPEGVDEFHAAAEADEAEPMTRFSHDLKSSAATLGLKRFSDLCREIELACKEERRDEARELGKTLRSELERALTALDDRSVADTGAVAVDESRTRFLAKMAHNLRNNVNTVLGCVSMLQEYGDDSSVEEIADFARQIQEEGDHLRGLASDFLTLVEMDAGIIDLAATDLDVTVEMARVLDGVTDRARERNVKIDSNAREEVTIAADAGAFRHMLSNLLINAVERSPEGGSVEISAAGDNGAVVFQVTDSGPEITDQDIQQVHSQYGGIHEVEGPRGVIGLRYHVAERLAQASGATLEFRTAGDGGTYVRLAVPNSSC